MNYYEMGQLGKLTHEERIRQGEEERLAMKAIERESHGKRWWEKRLLFLFLQA